MVILFQIYLTSCDNHPIQQQMGALYAIHNPNLSGCQMILDLLGF